MAKQFKEITPDIKEFIYDQKMFFVGTAANNGRVNISPKGMDSLRVIDANKIVWLNLTGSGNETAAHIMKNNRITIMFCAFEGKPLILRLYGEAMIFHPRDNDYHKYISLFPERVGARQIFEINVEMVQTSCGFGVPIYEYSEDRSQLVSWGKNKSAEDLKDYWQNKNTSSIDGYATGIYVRGLS